MAATINSAGAVIRLHSGVIRVVIMRDIPRRVVPIIPVWVISQVEIIK